MFDDWFNELEGFALRSERIIEDVFHPDSNSKDFIKYLKAAYEAGYEDGILESFPKSNLQKAAELLNGREYRDEDPKEIISFLKDNRLVAVFGASDDLVEFRGMIHDECGGPGLVFFTNLGILPDDEALQYGKFRKPFNTLEALWDKEGYSWIYKFSLPHETFDILEDGEKYCRGIVFRYDDLYEGVA